MAGIFISYRRDDSAGYTGRLLDDMKVAFGQEQIFRDIEAIEAGADFYETIDTAVASCSVLLAIVGPRWLSAANAKGQRRLDDANDFVRIEIAAALKRNIKVIPVLVDGATMPAMDELPDDLKALARRNALEMTDRRWDYDVKTLFGALDKVPGLVRFKQPTRGAAPPPAPKQGMSTGLKLFLAVVVAVGALVIYGVAQEANQTDTANLAQPPANFTAAAPRIDSPALAPPAAVTRRLPHPCKASRLSHRRHHRCSPPQRPATSAAIGVLRMAMPFTSSSREGSSPCWRPMPRPSMDSWDKAWCAVSKSSWRCVICRPAS